MQRVTVYIRHNGTRTLRESQPQTIYPTGALFVMRYALNVKRVWKTSTPRTTGKRTRPASIKRNRAYPRSASYARAQRPRLNGRGRILSAYILPDYHRVRRRQTGLHLMLLPEEC